MNHCCAALVQFQARDGHLSSIYRASGWVVIIVSKERRFHCRQLSYLKGSEGDFVEKCFRILAYIAGCIHECKLVPVHAWSELILQPDVAAAHLCIYELTLLQPPFFAIEGNSDRWKGRILWISIHLQLNFWILYAKETHRTFRDICKGMVCFFPSILNVCNQYNWSHCPSV